MLASINSKAISGTHMVYNLCVIVVSNAGVSFGKLPLGLESATRRPVTSPSLSSSSSGLTRCSLHPKRQKHEGLF